MTEPRAGASALPLSVTYTPDGHLAEALKVLVGRVGGSVDDPERVGPFVAAIQDVVGWVEAHRSAVAGDVALVFDRAGDTLRGDLRWATHESGTARPDVPAAAPGVEVTCDVSGAQVHCRVSCRCA